MQCDHCGLPLGEHVVDERFCCASCAAVYGILHESGMAETFYRLQQVGSEGPVRAGEGPSIATLAELESPVFLERHTREVSDDVREAELYLDGVHCAACVWLVERMPQAVPGVQEARLDLSRGRLRLRWNPSRAGLRQIAEWLGGFGYTPHPVSAQVDASRNEERRLLSRLGLAWALAANTMLIAAAFYVGLDGGDAGLFEAGRWLSLGLAIPALAYAGRVFFVRAWASLRRAWRSKSLRHLDMDTPVALGLTVGFTDSAWATISGSGEIWFDSLTVLVAALLTARWLQFRSRRLAAESADRLLAILPTMATVRRDDGSVESLSTEDLVPGDVVCVGPGEPIPADGTVIEGRSRVDRSSMTGESRPEAVEAGAEVLAGTLNLSEAIWCVVSRRGGDSRLGRLLSTASQDRDAAPIVDLADRLSGYFVATVLLLAVMTAGIWLLIDPSSAVGHTVALLVVTCPCALGMATPLAMAVATGRAARVGIFVRQQAALQTLEKADIVVLDKTGTVTEGRLRLIERFGDTAAIDLAAALESGINHPVARALRDAARRTSLPTDGVTFEPGSGVEGVVSGRQVRVGRPSWVAQGASDPGRLLIRTAAASQEGRTPLAISVDGVIRTALGFGDDIRPDCSPFITDLQERGLTIFLLSGDEPDVTERVGLRVGIPKDRIFGGASPEDKRRLVAGWQTGGRIVTMIGDGLNDAPALAMADVGIAIDSDNQAGRYAADIVVSRDGLSAITTLLSGSRGTMRVIRRNLALSLGYNLTMAALAVAGFVTPLVAAVAMPISSLSVVLSSLNLRAFRRPDVVRADADRHASKIAA